MHTLRSGSETLERAAPLVFIHAAPRTSSTWFWSKFRELPSTLCYYEPFNDKLIWLTPDRAETLQHDSWESRHTPTDPYYQEYTPLIGENQGVRLSDAAMAFQWFIPQGGLRGELRPREKDYLSLLIGHAREAGKIPVFGGWRSLGRVWAIKQAFGGLNIFQYRNLWQQWLSMLSYKRRGSLTFYISVIDTLFRDGEPYFSYLVERGLVHAADPRTGKDPTASPLTWTRSYPNVARDEAKVRQLELLPEHYVFALFMGLQIYLYLHARISADLAVDITTMARDDAYRSDIEQTIRRQIGLPVSFADADDVEPPGCVEFDHASVDWAEIREFAGVAVEMLSKFADPAQLSTTADALVDDTITEMRKLAGATAALGALTPTATKPLDVTAKTIGLCMIVKDEAHVILKCLESVRPLVDHVLVVDTGSTDGTQQIIRDYLGREKLPGGVVEEPWQNFSYNRTFALQELRKTSCVDYALIIDADDQLELDDGFDPAAFKAGMDQDLYDVEISHGNIAHIRPQLFRNDLAFFFKGVVHEYLEATPGDLRRGRAKGFRVKISGGGARSRNARKFEDDAALLERTLSIETDPFLISRYTFYLAQSYRDCGEKEKALANYLKRAELGYWVEEIYVSLYEAGNLMAALGSPFDEVIATYIRASDLVPTRAEALHAASRYCRDKGRNADGYEIARRGIDLPQPAGALFAQPWVYDYGLLDEYAVNAYWAGAYRESLDASLRLLVSDKLPQSMHARVAANARFAAEKLPTAKAPDLGRFGAESLVEQHKLVPQRWLHSRVLGAPRVMVAILAKQKERALPLYLQCIEDLDYPKSSIVLYIRTNNNTDTTEQILREWVKRVGSFYHAVEFDASDVAERVEQYREHEWNATRFSVLGRIRNQSLRRARELECAYYFVADVDNFVRRATLRELVALDLPIVAPLLRSIDPGRFYSNYHAEVDSSGYFKGCDQYYWILSRHVRGVFELPVVHCTYLVRADVIPKLTYEDDSGRYEYVIFSDSARKSGIPQYLDNRQVYGYVTFGEGEHYVEGGIERARALLAAAGDETIGALAGDRKEANGPLPHRAIRLKEFPRSTQGVNTPPDWYIGWADSSLKAETFTVRTDENGFILPEPMAKPGAPKVIFLGDSFLEGMFARPEDRVCSRLQEILKQEAGLDIAILNAGYSGATALHSFNTLINKILPLRPAAVVLMTGMVDFDAALLKASFWSQDPFIRPIIEINAIDPPRDQDKHSVPNYEDQTRLMLMFAEARRVFGIPLWFATIPHRQLFTGEHIERAGISRVDFDNGRNRRCAINDITRTIAKHTSIPLFDVERDLAGKTDIFYDMFHLNARGGEAVARSLLKCGFTEELAGVLNGITDGSDRPAPLVTNMLPRQKRLSTINIRLPLYVINLDRSTDRLTDFKERNAHIASFTRFRAIDGASLCREALIEEKVITPDLAYSAGALGCAMSHIALWRLAETENKAITVAEDDAIFSRQFEARSQALLADLRDDWDFVLWSTIPGLFTWLEALPGGAGAKIEFYQGKLLENLDQFQAAEQAPALIRLLHAFGTGCYSVSPQGARVLLDRCLPIRNALIEFSGFGIRNENEGIDSVMAGIYPMINALVCIPPLVVMDDRREKSIRRNGQY